MTFSLIRGRVLRVTKLDGCGAKVLGPSSSVVSKGFTTVALTANTNTGTPVSVVNANGDNCIVDTPVPKFQSWNVVISFCEVDPYLYTLLTGNPVVLAADGTTVTGFDVNSDVDQSTSGLALELWSATPSTSCVAGTVSYGYQLLPFLQGGIVGDYTVQNDAVTFQVTGLLTKDGNAWGVGPYNVVKNVSGVDSPLNTALSTKNHLHLDLVTTAPPTNYGVNALGVVATGATAGIPATLTPANSYAPLNLADFGAHPVTATPSTAWTTGQYLLCRDGSKVHWSSSAWVAGVA